MPFDDDGYDASRRPKKGVKISNKDSTVPQPKSSGKAVFEGRAENAFSTYEEYKQRTWDLSTKYKSFIEDKILPENKSIITRELEKEVLDKLVALASDMNADEYQPEGIGSVALNMLLMKCMLIQRDTINSLAYKVQKLERETVEIKSAVKKSNDDTAKDRNNS